MQICVKAGWLRTGVAAMALCQLGPSSANLLFNDDGQCITSEKPDSAPVGGAVVVGVDAYRLLPLGGVPLRDAELITETLDKVGYQVTTCRDVTASRILRAVSDAVATEAKRKDAGPPRRPFYIYFSGHGSQIGSTEVVLGRDVDLSTGTPERATGVPGLLPLHKLAAIVVDAGLTPVLLMDTHRPGGKAAVGEVCQRRDAVTIYASTGEQPALSAVKLPGAEVSPFATMLGMELSLPQLSLATVYTSLKRNVSALVEWRAGVRQVPELCDAGGLAEKIVPNSGQVKAQRMTR